MEGLVEQCGRQSSPISFMLHFLPDRLGSTPQSHGETCGEQGTWWGRPFGPRLAARLAPLLWAGVFKPHSGSGERAEGGVGREREKRKYRGLSLCLPLYVSLPLSILSFLFSMCELLCWNGLNHKPDSIHPIVQLNQREPHQRTWDILMNRCVCEQCVFVCFTQYHKSNLVS